MPTIEPPEFLKKLIEAKARMERLCITQSEMTKF
jgi:hypothetical protein